MMDQNKRKSDSLPRTILWIAWTIWFVLDPHLNLHDAGIEWTLSVGVASWFAGILILALGVRLRRTYGVSALLVSLLTIFFFLWGLSILTEVLPNPFQLISVWSTTSVELYLSFLSWLEGWVVCLAAALWIGKKWKERCG